MALPAMSTADLLHLSPDKLLATRSLADCVQVGAQLGREVDKKREELRVMVGERYRDLIEAADTIQNMKLSAGQVISSVASMRSSCAALQQQAALAGLTSSGEKVADRDSPNTPYLKVAASTKLLMCIPERIWASVEGGRLAEGAQLFLLAQYVHTGLQGGAGGGLTAEKVSAWFPVIPRQWATIESLHSTLLSRAGHTLSLPSLQQPAARDALLCTLLLRSCPLQEVFQEFLSLRQEVASTVLLQGRQQTARTALASTVSMVLATVTVGTELFLKGGLEEAVRGVLGAGPSLALLGVGTLGALERWLPGPVRSFLPRLEGAGELEEGVVRAGLDLWCREVGAGARSEGAALLEYVDSVSGLGGVREELRRALGEQGEGGEGSFLWDGVYREVLTGRVLALLQARVVEVRGEVCSAVGALLEDPAHWKGLDWVWGEAGADLTKRGGGATGLALKCSGWEPGVQEVLAILEMGLAGVWGAAREYCVGEEQTAPSPFDRFADSARILEAVGEVVGAAVGALVTDCRQKAAALTVESNGAAILLLGRVQQAAFALCPALTAVLGAGSERQEGVKQLLGREAGACFTAWVTVLLDSFSSSLGLLSSSSPLSVLPAWDRLTIQETGEEGMMVASVIQIPPSPSLPLHSSLLSLSSSLHSGHAASLPPSCLSLATSSLLSLLLAHYTSLAADRLPQNLALQFSFDLQFLQTLLVSREAKDRLAPTFSDLITRLEANIDPFDLSVFTGHLATRVRWAAARSVSGLGCLVPGDRVSLVSSYKPPSSATTGQEGHNVLPLPASPAPRFQLLPLPSPSSLPSPPGHSGQSMLVSETKKPTTRRNRDRSPAPPTASSFFNSMSQGWFGGSTSTS